MINTSIIKVFLDWNNITIPHIYLTYLETDCCIIIHVLMPSKYIGCHMTEITSTICMFIPSIILLVEHVFPEYDDSHVMGQSVDYDCTETGAIFIVIFNYVALRCLLREFLHLHLQYPPHSRYQSLLLHPSC